MGAVRFLFAPDLAGPAARSLSDAAATVRSAAAGLRPPAGGTGPARPPPAAAALGSALILAGAGLGAAIAADLLAGAPAAAQTAPPVFEQVDEGTRDLLAFLTDLADGRNTALGTMFGVYNVGVMVLSGALLVWWTLAGTVDTAQRGRWGFGGKELVRIALAVALMVPVAGGLAGGQHLILLLARLGGSFATSVWEPFSGEVLVRDSPVAPRPEERGLRLALTRYLLGELCMRTANAAAAGPPPVRKALIRGVHYWSGDTSRGMPRALCGSVAFSARFGNSPEARLAAMQRAALLSRAPAVGAAAARLAGHFVPGRADHGRPLPDVEALLDAAGIGDAYIAEVRAGIDRALPDSERAMREAVRRDAAQAGWLGAASVFSTIARRSGSFAALAADIPQVELPHGELGKWSPPAAAAVKAVSEALASSEAYPTFAGNRPGLGSVGVFGGGTAISAMPGGLLDWIDVSDIAVADTGAPLRDLADFGHSLILKGLWTLAALTGLAIKSEALANVGGVFNFWKSDVFEGAWQVLDSAVSMAIGLMVLSGLVLAYLLPLIPWIRFFFATLGWLVSIVAALLAVPVWLAAHLTRGEDNLVTPATQRGWLILPGLVLRPALMLFGLVLGHVLCVVVMGLLNATFTTALADASAASGIGLLGWLVMTVIYVMIAYAAVNACFKLVDLLPQAVLDWLGGRDGADGGEADRLTGGVAGAFGRLGPLRIGSRRGRPGGSAP